MKIKTILILILFVGLIISTTLKCLPLEDTTPIEEIGRVDNNNISNH